MLNMAKLTWGFDLFADKDAIDWNVKTSYTDGFVFSPKQFPVHFTPRSQHHRDIIEAEFHSQRDVFAQFED